MNLLEYEYIHDRSSFSAPKRLRIDIYINLT